MIVVLPLSTIRLFGDPDQDGLCIGVCNVLWRRLAHGRRRRR